MKFGTSGLRGLSVDLKGQASALYATAFGRYLLDSGMARHGDALLIGQDFRDSSPEIAVNCTDALAGLGFDVYDCGSVPTPALALYGLQQKAACLMVTGSHIPADRNGIKFYRPDGEIDKADEAAITGEATKLDRASFAFEPRGTKPQDRSAECLAAFRDRNANILPTGALTGLKVGVYQHSTVARDLLVELLEHFGATVVPFGRSETFIPVDTEAVSKETIAKLKDVARQHRLDAVVSADGDGDRPLVADVSDIDGLRVTLTDRRIIHFRPSGNAPEMRCYAEAESEGAAQGLLRAGLERIRWWAQAN